MAEYSISKQDLLNAIRYDCEVFLGFYIGEELELQIPDFHVEIWDEFLTLLDKVNSPEHLVGILYKLLAVPREHAKTTLTKLAILLFLRYSRLAFCAYTSNTFGTALNAIRDVRDWFMSPRDQELYGPAKIQKSSESEGLFILEIHTPIQSKPKKIIMKAFGQGTQIRGTIIDGRRPDILVFDDIESVETAESPLQQAKLDAWCFGTALKAMARRGICIFIGNMISDTTLLARLSKDEEWNPTVLGSLVKTKAGELSPLWPGRWTIDALLHDYAKYRKTGLGHIWEAEMMNLTASEVLGESLDNAIRPPKPMPEDLAAGFVCLDPAFGTKGWNDESAITVHARLVDGDIPMVIESEKGRWKTDEVFDRMLGASIRWGIKTWVIEAQAAQRLLIPYFKALMQQRQINPETFTLLPIFAGKESKAARIVTFRGAVAKGSYAIVDSETELVDQLEEYVPGGVPHDDLPDSAAYGTQVWSLYGETVSAQGVTNVAGILFGNYAQSTVIGSSDMGIP